MRRPAIWFPAIRAGTGADVFTQRLCDGLQERDIRAEITWLPHRAEYLPWSVPAPKRPEWANIVHLNTWLHRRFVPRDLPVVSTMHLCVHDEALAPYKTPAQALYHRRWVKPLESWILDRSQRIIAVSNYTAERTQAAFAGKDVRVIHNGVPLPDEVNPPPQRQSHEPFRLLYVGNWSRRKGVDLLGPIMKELGDGYELWYTADARGAHIGAKLPSTSKCLGRLNQEQLFRVYQQADALIFPSRMEGLPLSVIEAMANGLPAIASNCSSLPELIENDVTGFLCQPPDVRSFVLAVRKLRASGVGSLSGAARSASRKFSIERMVGGYIDCYESLLLPSHPTCNKHLFGPQ